MEARFIFPRREPNGERFHIVGGTSVYSTLGGAWLWWCSERSVPKLKVGLEQWNFTTVGVSEICPMDWAYYPFCGRGDKSPKHHTLIIDML